MLYPMGLYGRDPLWVPPLLMTEFLLHDRERHPFHQHADVEHFLARRDGRIAGRIVATVNHEHNKFHRDQVGFWGFLDAENDPEVVRALFQAAEASLRKRGMRTARGPMNFSVNETCGMLVEGFDTPPFIMMTHNPTWLPGLVEQAGYAKVMDLLAFHVRPEEVHFEPFHRLRRLLGRPDIRERSIDKRNLAEEVKLINSIYNDAWQDNWGFVPMTDPEIAQMAKELKDIFNPELSLMIELKGEPVAFAIGLPDVNPLFKKIGGKLLPFGWARLLWGLGKLNQVRVLVLGVRKRLQKLGLGVLAVLRITERAIANGFTGAELSWVLESNRKMIHPLEALGARLYKRYRIYDKSL